MGDCGLPVFAIVNGEPKLIGLHTGLTGNVSYATSFSIDDFPIQVSQMFASHRQGTTLVTPSRLQASPGLPITTRIPPIQLDKFAEKFATKEVFTVTSSTQPLKRYAFPADVLLAQALYAQSAMRYVAFDLVVRVTPLGSGWVGMPYILSFFPYLQADATTVSPGSPESSPVALTSVQYALVDLSSNEPVELVIPYRYHKEFFNSADPTEYFGTVVLSPSIFTLQVPSVGTNTVDVEVQFGTRNFYSFVPSEIGNSVLFADVAAAPDDWDAISVAQGSIMEEVLGSEGNEDTSDSPLTLDEIRDDKPVAPIATAYYPPDPRVINHLSDILKRPFSLGLFAQLVQGIVVSLPATLQNNVLVPNNSSNGWLLSLYRAWKGDLVYAVENLQPQPGDENMAILQPITELSGTAAGTDANLPFRANFGFSFTVPNDTPPAIGSNSWGGDAPMIISGERRFRFNVPYHSLNKFTVYDPFGTTGLPTVDTQPASEVDIYFGNQLSADPVATTFRIIQQTADSYRLSHFCPTRMNLAAIYNGSTYQNFPGIYLPIA
jgi:hypothetical protein